MSNVTSESPLKSGYDVDVYGIDDGTFYKIHIPAIICICVSLTSAILAIVLSFRQKSYRSFFDKWSKSERFVVYLALCDGLFNMAHFTDHLHIAIVRDHVYPAALCRFYGFMLAEFITAQNLMVNVVAINAFMLMYFNKNLNFGRCDWRLLLWTFGTPFLGSMIALALGQLGPNGVFCYFDAVKGKLANIFFTTVPLLIVIILNTILYILTWVKLHQQASRLDAALQHMSASMRASHRAARAMSLFVIAFFVQWWAMAMYGIMQLVTEDIPQAVFHLVTTFSNIGGLLNLLVFLVMRRRRLSKGENVSDDAIRKANITLKNSSDKTLGTLNDTLATDHLTSEVDRRVFGLRILTVQERYRDDVWTPAIIWVYYLPCWVIITPAAIIFIIIMSGVNYVPAYYGDYEYPGWAESVGWILAVLPISMVLIGAIIAIVRSGGNLRLAAAPLPEWGPRLKANRTGPYNDNYGYEPDSDEEKPPMNGTNGGAPYTIQEKGQGYPEFDRL